MPRLDQKTQVGVIATTDLIVCLRGGAFVLGGVGSMALQNAGAVNIDGGAIDGTPIGANTPSTISATAATFSGTVLVGRESVGTMSGDGVIGLGAQSGFISNKATLANNATVDIGTAVGGGGYQGILSVSNVRSSNANLSTKATFSVFGRDVNGSVQQIHTFNGVDGAASFTVTIATGGLLRVTNTAGAETVVVMTFIGGTSA
jgi:hypothetical protein